MRRQSIRPDLTDDFLATLVEAAKIIGWAVDYIEVEDFVANVFELAGKSRSEMPDMEPYVEDVSDGDGAAVRGAP